DQADIGEEAQLQTHPALFAGLARLRLARGPVRGRGEVGVPPPSPPPAGQDEPLAGGGEIGQPGPRRVIEHRGAHGDRDEPVLGLDVNARQIDKHRTPRDGIKKPRARRAQGVPEALKNPRRRREFLGWDGAREAYDPAGSAGNTETCRPSRPRRSNRTTPGTRAKSVSSLPRPTFRPGWYRVPRCRTRTLPAVTVCPANRFTPSRCELLS